MLTAIRTEIADLPESGIVEVVNYGRGKEGLIPLWAGEGDLVTPDFICDAAIEALRAGETFYTYQRGIPELRQALSDYHERVFGKCLGADRFFVTGSGMQAIQTAVQTIIGAGDEVVAASPVWPNLAGAVEINGGRVVTVPMGFGEAGWTMDLEGLFAAVGDKTKAIFVNSPGNPSGVVLGLEEITAIRDFARTRGIWIIADEVYARFYYGADRAPSFLDVCEPDEKLLVVNTFSKNWAMTGWRIGWIIAPVALGQVMENLIQYNTSGVPGFLQKGCVAALNDGDAFLRKQVIQCEAGRDILFGALSQIDCIRAVPPKGAFYMFFEVDGKPDARQLALDLVDTANVGLAPGSAFGPGGDRFLRACFAISHNKLREAGERLINTLG